MSLRGFGRVIKLGLLNFWRNWWLSVASVLVMAVTLFIISVFTVQNLVIRETTAGIQDKLDLSVYFNDEVEEEKIQEIRRVLINRPDVKSVEYVSKDKALEIFQSRQTSDRVKSLITPEENPLPRSLVIKANDPAQLQALGKLFEEEEYKQLVRRVSSQDNGAVIDTLIDTAKSVRQSGIILTIVFVLLSFILIYNTVRIVILSRSDEIEIMRLVGSTEAFVRWPFLIEASLYGILGALLALGALFLFLKYDLASAVPLLSIANFLAPDMLAFYVNHFFVIAGILLSAGALSAMCMSVVAVRRFVRI